MRVKTDARRNAIARAAWEVFQKRGFDGTTMAEISERVGGSKATIYGYFGSKEELFVAALEEASRPSSDESFDYLRRPGSLRERLTGFARPYMRVRLSDDMINMERVLISEAGRTNLGEVLRAKFIVPNWQRLGAVMEQEMKAGALRTADPYRTAVHFSGLIEADLVERRLHGEPSISPADIESAVADGVDAFLRAYAA